jgi:AraC-like DNA-binding protein
MASQVNFRHEADQGVIDSRTRYVHEFNVSREKFQVQANLGERGSRYLTDKRIIDGRLPFLRATSYVSRTQCWRAARVADSLSSPVAFILAPKVGSALVAHAGMEVELRPGQYTVCVSSEPTISYYSASSEVILAFIPDIGMVQDRRLTRNIGKEKLVEGAGRLLLRYLDSSLEIAPVLDPLALAAASSAAGELITSMVLPGSSADAGADTLYEQMKTYIELKLHEPGLGADQVAAAHYVSVRTVYRLFDKSGRGVAEYIRARRMERCRAEIERRPDLSLTAICQRFGIPDPKHFARQYRRYFDESPSEARRRLRE